MSKYKQIIISLEEDWAVIEDVPHEVYTDKVLEVIRG